MPKKINQEDSELYPKLLIGFSIGQLLLALIYFIWQSVVTPAILVLALVCVVSMVLVHMFWDDKRWIRVIVRCVCGLLAAAVTVLAAVTTIGMLAAGTTGEAFYSAASAIVGSFVQTVLLCLLPAYVLSACHKRKLDIICLRIVSILECVIAVFMAAYAAPRGYIALGIDNVYVGWFFALCTAVTMVLSFILQPPAMPKWLTKMAEKHYAATVKMRGEGKAAEEPADAPEALPEESDAAAAES